MNRSDPFEYLSDRYRSMQPDMAWVSGDVDWQARSRQALVQAVGIVNEAWSEPFLSLETYAAGDGFTRLAVKFPSREGWSGSGWLLVPEQRREPGPAVICLPGHGPGTDAIVGLAEDSYQSNFALQCVEQGWVTLALEQVSFGANQSSRDSAKGSSCAMDSLFSLVLGETMTGWRVRDALAAYRALGTYPLVDPDRIATLGISGGGLTALWTAALEPGICAAGVSGYFCPMAHSILRFDHCPDNYIPGLAKIMDVPDLAGLIAPRWLAVESGTDDPIFAADGFKQASARAQEIYNAAGVQEHFASDLFEGDHVFHGAVLFEHLRRAFEEQPAQVPSARTGTE